MYTTTLHTHSSARFFFFFKLFDPLWSSASTRIQELLSTNTLIRLPRMKMWTDQTTRQHTCTGKHTATTNHPFQTLRLDWNRWLFPAPSAAALNQHPKAPHETLQWVRRSLPGWEWNHCCSCCCCCCCYSGSHLSWQSRSKQQHYQHTKFETQAQEEHLDEVLLTQLCVVSQAIQQFLRLALMRTRLPTKKHRVLRSATRRAWFHSVTRQ